ncbi:MAG TPA: cytochrome c biogenesis protein ResB [Marmoricola sp.]|jgi:cytochrome c biogenesis protein|nr:cytochrome c biogenesis protein ResB [Marmoricola sp.]
MTTTPTRPQPDEREYDAMPLAPREFGRWIWRQLTSMRTALVLLFLLALAAVPGSVVPQDAVDAFAASQWREKHPDLAPVYDKLGLFNVYGSVWFSAIYILLMISLVGCIVPRCKVYLDALRARPPRPPRHLDRLPEQRSFATDEDAGSVLQRARTALRGYRVVAHDDSSLSAERGYLREAGNLLFHVSVIVVLVGFAAGSLFGFKGGVIVVKGHGFTNTLTQYDDFRGGKLFDEKSLEPFSFTVDDFDVTFITEGREAGMAHEFTADLTYRRGLDGKPVHRQIAVNHPLGIDGTKVYLLSHGYAPHITVRDGSGEIAFSGPVVFLPEDATFRSFGVVKVPDARDAAGRPVQLGFEGELYPTYGFTMQTGPFSAFPDDKDPLVSLTAWRGDLGVNDGAPQSVYALKKKGLTRIEQPNGKPVRLDLPLGATRKLPDGLGSVSFDGISPFVKLQVSRTPADWLALLGVSLALLGLVGSLFLRPRRVWVRVRRADDGSSRTLVEVAGLDRSSGGDLGAELDKITAQLEPRRGETA